MILLVSLSILTFFLSSSSTAAKEVKVPKFGPYKVVLVSSKHCDNPSLPYEAVPSANYSFELYNTTKKVNLLRGYVNVFKGNYRGAKCKIKSYQWMEGKWQISFYKNNLECNNRYFSTFMNVFGVAYNTKTCSIRKGAYRFEGFDIDQAEHLFTKTREYGRQWRRTETYTKTNTITCWDVETVVTPI